MYKKDYKKLPRVLELLLTQDICMHGAAAYSGVLKILPFVLKNSAVLLRTSWYQSILVLLKDSIDLH